MLQKRPGLMPRQTHDVVLMDGEMAEFPPDDTEEQYEIVPLASHVGGRRGERELDEDVANTTLAGLNPVEFQLLESATKETALHPRRLNEPSAASVGPQPYVL